MEGRYPEVTKVWLLPHYSGYYCCQAAGAVQQGDGRPVSDVVRPVTLQIVLLPSWGWRLENAAAPCRGWLSLLNWPLGHPGRQPGHSGP